MILWMNKSKSKTLRVIVVIIVVVCSLGIRVYNGRLFFFDLPDRSGWVDEGDGLRYLDRHANIVTNTLLQIGSETYYFESDGAVCKGELKLGSYTYYFDELTGAMQTGWLERSGKRYYYEENGHQVIGREYRIEGLDFLFGADGAEHIGPATIDGKQYYFEPVTGKLLNGEKKLDGFWYYYSEDGSKFGTGWARLADGRVCYYDGDAGMLTGEQTIDGQPYLLSISLGGRLIGTAYFNGEVYDIGADGVVKGKERIPIWSGIDVSWHQEAHIDWAKVKASGVQFVIVRAGYIDIEEPFFVQDDYFVQNVLGAQAQGISVGAYIYLYNHTKEGLAEALDSFHDAAVEGRVRLDLPVFLDVEDSEYFKPETDKLGGYGYRTDLVRFGMDWLRAKGYDAGFYTFARWAGTEFDVEQLYSEGYPFWLARWYGNDEDLDPGTLAWGDDKQPSLWQYRATGKVNGIAKEVDKNYLYWGRMP